MKNKFYFLKTVLLNLSIIILLISCSQEENNNPDYSKYYFKTEIDGENWDNFDTPDIGFGVTHRQLNTNSGLEDFYQLSIYSIRQEENPICNYLSIIFSYIPSTTGKFYFDNDLASFNNVGATFSRINPHSLKWSINGYVVIESINRKEIKGTFVFEAKGDINHSTITKIKGDFFVPNTHWEDWEGQ